MPPCPWLALEGADDLPEFALPRASSLDEAIHPELARAVIRHIALGVQLVLHAGALVVDSRAWLLSGARESGKSTLLHAAHRRGLMVVTDDTAIIDGEHVLSGPRCLDLRAPTPDTVAVRDGQRHRLALPPAPWRAAVAGIVHLRWTEGSRTPGLIALGPAERVPALDLRQFAPAQAARVLDLAVWPAYELWRSPSQTPDAALDALLAVA